MSTGQILTLDKLTPTLSLREKTSIQSCVNSVMGLEDAFTPTIIGSTTPGTQTYSNQIGHYRVIGDILFFSLSVDISNKDVAMAGNVYIGGFPIPTKNLTNLLQATTLSDYLGVTLGAGFTQLACYFVSNATSMYVTQVGSGVASTLLPVTGLANTSYFIVSGFYFI